MKRLAFSLWLVLWAAWSCSGSQESPAPNDSPPVDALGSSAGAGASMGRASDGDTGATAEGGAGAGAGAGSTATSTAMQINRPQRDAESSPDGSGSDAGDDAPPSAASTADASPTEENDEQNNEENNEDEGATDVFDQTAPMDQLGCVVSVQLRECCGPPRAASGAEIASDECLVPYSERRADPDLTARCREAVGGCADAQCGEPGPLSRSAADTGAGSCKLVDECVSDADCALASHAGYCCSCPAPYPIDVIASDRCIIPEGEQAPPGVHEACFIACTNCGVCPPTATPSCIDGPDGYRICALP